MNPSAIGRCGGLQLVGTWLLGLIRLLIRNEQHVSRQTWQGTATSIDKSVVVAVATAAPTRGQDARAEHVGTLGQLIVPAAEDQNVEHRDTAAEPMACDGPPARQREQVAAAPLDGGRSERQGNQHWRSAGVSCAPAARYVQAAGREALSPSHCVAARSLCPGHGHSEQSRPHSVSKTESVSL